MKSGSSEHVNPLACPTLRKYHTGPVTDFIWIYRFKNSTYLTQNIINFIKFLNYSTSNIDKNHFD